LELATVRHIDARTSKFKKLFNAVILYQLEKEIGNDKGSEHLLFKDFLRVLWDSTPRAHFLEFHISRNLTQSF
jgi:hypothetical protein